MSAQTERDRVSAEGESRREGSMSESGGLSIALELVDRLMRSWWTIVAGLCLGLACSLAALQVLPRTYEAATKILVTPPKIPQDFIRNTVSDDTAQRIAAMKAEVLSRKYMTQLIEANFGKRKEGDELETERLIQSIQGSVDVTVESYSGDRLAMFSLKFRDSDPKRAANIVNGLADLYIAANSDYRSGRARETTNTIEQLADSARKQLEKKEREIADYRSQHLYELPDRLEPNLRLLEARQRDLDVNSKSLESAQDRLQLLQAQLTAGAGGQGSVVSGSDPYSTRLAQLQRELAAVRARYNEDHPEVRAKERELNDFIASNSGGSAGEEHETGATTARSPLQRDIQSQQREIGRLQEEQK